MNESDSVQFKNIVKILNDPQSDNICFILVDDSELPTLTKSEAIVRSDGENGYISDARCPVTIDSSNTYIKNFSNWCC